MKKTTQNINDVNFILQEIFRFTSMPWSELKDLSEDHRRDFLCCVPHPDGRGGSLICGREAYNRFYELAKRCLSSEEKRDDFDLQAFTRSIREEFVRVFLKEQKEVDERSVSKMLAAAMKKIKKMQKSLTHYIPCVIVFENQPDRFQIGPVHFTTIENFLNDHRNDFEKKRHHLRNASIEHAKKAVEKGKMAANKIPTLEDSAKHADMMVDKLLEYFKGYKWVASVTIPPCDEKVSLERAQVTVEAALNVLRLFFGAFYGNKLRQGHSRGMITDTANLTRDADGNLFIAISQKLEHVPGGDNWFQTITDNYAFYLEAAGSALNSYLETEGSSHLCQRFLDALNWYGQAVTEQMTSAQIIKYAAALERLTVTKKEKDLTPVVTRRTALLNFDGSKEDFGRCKKDASKVYEWRSNLMHGSCSPFEKKLGTISNLAQRMTQCALFRSLGFFLFVEHTCGYTQNNLEESYQSWETKFIQA